MKQKVFEGPLSLVWYAEGDSMILTKTYHDQDPAFDKHLSVWVHSTALKSDLNHLSVYGASPIYPSTMLMKYKIQSFISENIWEIKIQKLDLLSKVEYLDFYICR